MGSPGSYGPRSRLVPSSLTRHRLTKTSTPLEVIVSYARRDHSLDLHWKRVQFPPAPLKKPQKIAAFYILNTMDSEKQEIEIRRIPEFPEKLYELEIIYKNLKGDISLTSGFIEDVPAFLQVIEELEKWGYEIIAYSFGKH